MNLKEVKFLTNHIPQMRSGEYTLKVQQTVSVQGHQEDATPFEATQHFAVGGHRYTLNPTEIDSIFPPNGNVGDHSNAIPNIVLKRSTLPWEWLAINPSSQGDLSAVQEAVPWMGLLVLQEDRRWRGTFSKTTFQSTVTNDSNVWTSLLSAYWISATNSSDTFNILPVEGRSPIALSTTMTSTLKNKINTFLSQYVISGVEKNSGVFSKKDFQSKVTNNSDLWTVLLTANWFCTTTADKDTFIATSPTSRLPFVGLTASTLGITDIARSTALALIQKIANKIEVYLDAVRKPKTMTIGDITVKGEDDVLALPTYLKFPSEKIEVFENPADKVMVIDIEEELLSNIMPTTNDLTNLAHVRQTLTKNKQNELISLGEEKVMIAANRMPAPEATCTAYLVSLQGRYSTSPATKASLTDLGTDKTLIRLVVLKKWSYTNMSHKKNFIGMLQHINGYTVVNDNLGQPANSNTSTFSLRIPEKSTNDAVEKYLSQGSVPLMYQLRDGNKIPSWYRGPLVTGLHLRVLPTPKSIYEKLVASADQLLRFDTTLKMFDTTYAAAWELGRMLLLRDKNVAVDLYQWKRRNKSTIRRAEQVAVFEHIPFQQTTDMDLEMPEKVARWFDDLRILKQVPFNYLVPKEEMLPTESLRFFQVDEYWMEALMDGAFSIGRVAYNYSKPVPNQFKVHQISGILLRSEVVSGWQNIQVDGFAELPPSNNIDDEAGLLDNQLTVLRQDLLSKNIMLVLFDGIVKTVDIHLKPEGLHFGFDQLQSGDTTYQKSLKDADGTESNKPFDIAWKNALYRTLDTEGIITNIKSKSSLKSINSAQFAFYMMEGVPKVRVVQKR